jgi:hypothetical protein
MPYHIGAQGSNGCSGYPVVEEGGKVVGCHATESEATNHLQALYANVEDAKKEDGASITTSTTPENPSNHLNPEVGIKHPQYIQHKENDPMCKCEKCMMNKGCTDMSKDCGDPSCDICATKSDCCPDITKGDPCWDGYVQRGMKPGDNGGMVPNCVPVEKANDLFEDSDDVVYETYSMEKADGYSPPAGARAAARKAIKFKEDGKAGGAGTNVGWTRAHQLANGESLSLSTVKRMYSYFSRHEVDKKGKDWANQSNPSNGYIMWLAWGGDAGYSWSRGIVQRETDKTLFADFGKDYTKSTRII